MLEREKTRPLAFFALLGEKKASFDPCSAVAEFLRMKIGDAENQIFLFIVRESSHQDSSQP